MRSPSWTRTWLFPKLRASLSLSAYPYPLTPVYRMARSQSELSPLTSGKVLISAAPYPLRKPPIVAWVASTFLTTRFPPFSVTPSGQASCPCVWACTAAGKAKAVASVRVTRAVTRRVRRSRGGGCPCQAGHGVSPWACVATGWIIMVGWWLHDQGTDGQIKIPRAPPGCGRRFPVSPCRSCGSPRHPSRPPDQSSSWMGMCRTRVGLRMMAKMEFFPTSTKLLLY